MTLSTPVLAEAKSWYANTRWEAHIKCYANLSYALNTGFLREQLPELKLLTYGISES